MTIYTIGFTQKTAEAFFECLKGAGIRKLIDIRLNNQSQLAAFAKKEDLRYFLRQICGAEYVHEPALAPTQELLDGFKKKRISWDEYEPAFRAILIERKAQEMLHREDFEMPTVLLCSEAKAEHCHRRLVAEFLSEQWGGVSICHL